MLLRDGAGTAAGCLLRASLISVVEEQAVSRATMSFIRETDIIGKEY
jgi:hypothetical protein